MLDGPPEELVALARTPDARRAKELALVLQAVGLPHARSQGPGGHTLLVPRVHLDRARAELATYLEEDADFHREEPRPVVHRGGAVGALLYAGALGLVWRLAGVGAFGLDWRVAGRADAARIVDGEWWRCFTALTLHSDFQHLASNLVFGGLYALLLSQVFGPGLAWCVALLAAGAGNALNALVSGPQHLSIGASTAVFACLGALAATQSVRRLRLGRGALARVAPLFVGALMLAWYGVGTARMKPLGGIEVDPTDNTDVGAHVAGFVCGLALGAAAAWLTTRGEPTRAWRLAAGWSVPLVLALSWWLALRG